MKPEGAKPGKAMQKEESGASHPASAKSNADDATGVPLPHEWELRASKLVELPAGVIPNIEGMRVPSSLRALMEFMGENFGYSISEGHGVAWRTNEAFPLFMAAYGDAFLFVWTFSPGEPMVELDHDPARFAAVLSAAGFKGQVVVRHLSPAESAGGLDEKALRNAVVESVFQRGWPVLLLDVPERGWASIITGYKDSGRTVTGWSAEGGDDRFIHFEPEKRREFSDWWTKATVVLTLTRQNPRPPQEQVYRSALEQGIRLLRMRRLGNANAGPAVFEDWAKAIQDPSLSTQDAETRQWRQRIMDPAMWDLATRRHYGRVFLNRVQLILPSVTTELERATECFAAEHDAMWEINRLGGAKGPGEELPKLADPDIRRQLARIILECRDRDLEAAQHLENALAKLRSQGRAPR